MRQLFVYQSLYPLFQKALKENAKIRETQEKIRRAKEAKEKAEREKKEKKLRQAAILDMTTSKTPKIKNFFQPKQFT